MLFIDTVNRKQPQAYKNKKLKVKTSNLCIEVTLPTAPHNAENGGRTAVCCLGSTNFAKYEEREERVLPQAHDEAEHGDTEDRHADDGADDLDDSTLVAHWEVAGWEVCGVQ
jgi:ribonucleotide reductase alpha subunit